MFERWEGARTNAREKEFAGHLWRESHGCKIFRLWDFPGRSILYYGQQWTGKNEFKFDFGTAINRHLTSSVINHLAKAPNTAPKEK